MARSLLSKIEKLRRNCKDTGNAGYSDHKAKSQIDSGFLFSIRSRREINDCGRHSRRARTSGTVSLSYRYCEIAFRCSVIQKAEWKKRRKTIRTAALKGRHQKIQLPATPRQITKWSFSYKPRYRNSDNSCYSSRLLWNILQSICIYIYELRLQYVVISVIHPGHCDIRTLNCVSDFLRSMCHERFLPDFLPYWPNWSIQ